MYVRKKIKVLVVDDSLLFREMLAKGISADPAIEVVATASDPYAARDKILEYEPDVMTLDVEMPRMSGIEFLKKLIPQYPMPVVVVSSVSDSVFEALRAGAIDFVTKPNAKIGKSIESVVAELIMKIKIASTAKVGQGQAARSASTRQYAQSSLRRSMIAIGASTGGTEAIHAILKALPQDLPGTVIVQHMPVVFTKMYADRLNNLCRMEIKEAEFGDVIRQGRVLIAPGDKHMRIKKSGEDFIVECFDGEKVNGHRPSVDVLFQSVAELVGRNAVGVILTGMGYDGAKGLLAMRKAGAATIGQDQCTSVVYGMPKVAFDIGAVARQVPLNDIAPAILANVREG